MLRFVVRWLDTGVIYCRPFKHTQTQDQVLYTSSHKLRVWFCPEENLIYLWVWLMPSTRWISFSASPAMVCATRFH